MGVSDNRNGREEKIFVCNFFFSNDLRAVAKIKILRSVF
jgi:hypothetical protein